MSRLDPIERYGRWALVAGASAGLGAAFATGAARHGFNVVLLARRKAMLEETASRISSIYGVETRCVVADLAQPGVDDLIVRATEGLDLGVFIYNAASEPSGLFLDIPLEEHRQNIEVNCWVPTVLCHRLGRKMIDRGRGAIVLVSSVAALQGIKIFVSYGGAKAYQLILGEGLWDEFREHGVDVLSYVVGATASSNYVGADAKVYAGASAEVVEASKSVLMPVTPEQVAERLFERLHCGPRQYSTDDDEAKSAAKAVLSRAEVVRTTGAVTSGLHWKKLRGQG